MKILLFLILGASDAQARTFTIYSAAAAGIEDNEEETEDKAMADRTFVISTSKVHACTCTCIIIIGVCINDK